MLGVLLKKGKYDFHTPEHYVYRSEKGLSEEIIRNLSKEKGEPDWMLKKRLEALKIFEMKSVPTWGPDLSKLQFNDLCYYLKPTDKKVDAWDAVPEEIKTTFDRLGIPEAEKKFLAGSSAQYESEVVYHHLKKEWEKKGILFTDTDTALQEHPDILKEYFGTVVPANDNKFAALNTAVWSGGAFVYIPEGVHADIPLQTYFRINAEKLGQFERTLIIADEGSSVSYIEGCFTKGTCILTNTNHKPIEKIEIGDKVLTHSGRYSEVYHTQVRDYSGNLYRIKVWGNAQNIIEVTEEHPFLCVKRTRKNERNRSWHHVWEEAKNLKKRDYLLLPINKKIENKSSVGLEIIVRKKKVKVTLPLSKEFFKLVGYYLSEGSVLKNSYLSFSFGSHERRYIEEVKMLLKKVFDAESYEVHHKSNRGTCVRVSSVVLARVFSHFGTKCDKKSIPSWMIFEDPKKQAELVHGMFNGDGNYFNVKYKYGLKEVFRINTTSPKLATQIRDILLRLNIVAFINIRNRKKEGRLTMYTVGLSGENLIPFGKLINVPVKNSINQHKRATLFFINGNYLYMPIKDIKKRKVVDYPVYNFSVKGDESYVAGGVAVHNCSAPVFSTASLHAAVVEIIAKKNSKVRYTTIQNWSNNVYNLVTKRSIAYENAVVEWLDGNMGSAVTQKYPTVILKGKGARAEILSAAYAGKGQIQDTGAKAIHLAPNTYSKIVSKSVCKDGGRASYRGLVQIGKKAKNSKSFVQCNAYLLDEKSRSDTYPTIKDEQTNAIVSHEAKVGSISKEKLFYLMSRGISEKDALAMIILGFMESFTRELPMEYAVELNRLIQLQMERSVG
ncbi:SufD family Fe-S cluster assembly protein [Candidatus Micrarchaeota archaeon]|nr:SufD family Fe-S cluster assembly protein [Candidatus Micrarchaeota archaeon]